MNIEYVLTDVQEISVSKNFQEDVEFELNTQTSYTVYYAEDSSSCMCDIILEVLPTHNSELLKIRYHSKSIFALNDFKQTEDEKKFIHVETYNRIFPMCCMQIKTAAAMAGLPDIPVNSLNMTEADVAINN